MKDDDGLPRWREVQGACFSFQISNVPRFREDTRTRIQAERSSSSEERSLPPLELVADQPNYCSLR